MQQLFNWNSKPLFFQGDNVGYSCPVEGHGANSRRFRRECYAAMGIERTPGRWWLLAIASVCLSITWGAAKAQAVAETDVSHSALFSADRYPSATECGGCHPKHYREWSVSQHAYAQMSPVFNAMHGTILKLTNGTNGDFCIRCHTPVGMNLGEPVFMSNIDRHPTSREGVTCIVCHRLDQNYGKLSGRLPILDGDLTQTVYGPVGNNKELEIAIDKAGLITDRARSGRKVHDSVDRLPALSNPSICGTCHDVTLVNGFRLEEAFSEFKNSPAAKRGESCQDCHMGKQPGRTLASKQDPDFERLNYDYGPAAKVGRHKTAPRKLTNHRFVGPDYSLLPPALFPLNIRAIREQSERDDPTAAGMATIRQWLQFDWEAGWGSDEFEDEVIDDSQFPDRWAAIDDRYDARELIEENLELLADMTERRLRLLKTGYILGDVIVEQANDRGIKFKVQVRNGTDGHNVPTGFDGERLIWLHVKVSDAKGALLLESGDLDPNGDLRDLHSSYVHNHQLPLDRQLFTLQSRFLVRMLRGGEREQVLPINYSASPLPFIRPEPRSTILLGRPSGQRKHKMGIAPGGQRWAHYSVEKSDIKGPGPYTASIELKAAMLPVNLINEIKDVGFDYNMSAADVAKNLVDGHQVIWQRDLILRSN